MNEIITEYKHRWTYKRVEIDMETMRNWQGNIDHIYVMLTGRVAVWFDFVARSFMEITFFNFSGMLQYYKSTVLNRKLWPLASCVLGNSKNDKTNMIFVRRCKILNFEYRDNHIFICYDWQNQVAYVTHRRNNDTKTRPSLDIVTFHCLVISHWDITTFT